MQIFLQPSRHDKIKKKTLRKFMTQWNQWLCFFGFFDIMHNILRFQIHRYSVCPGRERESWLTHPDFLLIFLPLYYMHMHGVTVSILAEVNEAFFIWSHNFSFISRKQIDDQQRERKVNEFSVFFCCAARKYVRKSPVEFEKCVRTSLRCERARGSWKFIINILTLKWAIALA